MLPFVDYETLNCVQKTFCKKRLNVTKANLGAKQIESALLHRLIHCYLYETITIAMCT